MGFPKESKKGEAKGLAGGRSSALKGSKSTTSTLKPARKSTSPTRLPRKWLRRPGKLPRAPAQDLRPRAQSALAPRLHSDVRDLSDQPPPRRQPRFRDPTISLTDAASAVASPPPHQHDAPPPPRSRSAAPCSALPESAALSARASASSTRNRRAALLCILLDPLEPPIVRRDGVEPLARPSDALGLPTRPWAARSSPVSDEALGDHDLVAPGAERTPDELLLVE